MTLLNYWLINSFAYWWVQSAIKTPNNPKTLRNRKGREERREKTIHSPILWMSAMLHPIINRLQVWTQRWTKMCYQESPGSIIGSLRVQAHFVWMLTTLLSLWMSANAPFNRWKQRWTKMWPWTSQDSTTIRFFDYLNCNCPYFTSSNSLCEWIVATGTELLLNNLAASPASSSRQLCKQRRNSSPSCSTFEGWVQCSIQCRKNGEIVEWALKKPKNLQNEENLGKKEARLSVYDTLVIKVYSIWSFFFHILFRFLNSTPSAPPPSEVFCNIFLLPSRFVSKKEKK